MAERQVITIAIQGAPEQTQELVDTICQYVEGLTLGLSGLWPKGWSVVLRSTLEPSQIVEVDDVER
jgi:hypothetical protein